MKPWAWLLPLALIAATAARPARTSIEELHDLGIDWGTAGERGRAPVRIPNGGVLCAFKHHSSLLLTHVSTHTFCVVAAVELLWEIVNITAVTGNAIMSSIALGGSDINSRLMTPKPCGNVTNSSGLQRIYIDTNNLSRKYKEIQKSPR